MKNRGLICAVNYKSDTYSISLIKNFQNISDGETDLVILDNSASSILKDYIQKLRLSNISYRDVGSNLGYFGAVKWYSRDTDFKQRSFVIVCNVDVKIMSAGFLADIRRNMHAYEVIAPSIITQDGVQQNPHRLTPYSYKHKLFYRFYFFHYATAKFLYYILNIRYKIKRNKTSLVNGITEIYSPHGSFIIFCKSYFNKGGYIDSGYFLYGEENSIAGICSNKELRIAWIPSLKVKHYESVSTGKGLSFFKYKSQQDSYIYIRKEYQNIL